MASEKEVRGMSFPAHTDRSVDGARWGGRMEKRKSSPERGGKTGVTPSPEKKKI